jgi:transposase
MVRYVGLDVHKRVVEAVCLAEDGQVLWKERFSLNRHTLGQFAEKFLKATDRVALEATTNTWAVARFLKPFVAEVVASNPLLTKAIAQAKVKTDKVDARVLAHLLRCDYLPRVWEPDEATQQLRELTSRRASLVGSRTAVRNRVHALMAVRLIETPLGNLFGEKGLEWLQQVELDEQGRMLLEAELRLAKALEREIEALDARLHLDHHGDARAKLLITLPGVSLQVALGLLAAWGDVQRFPDGDHAAGYLGLAPRTRQSADRCYHGPITKAGRGHARWMLVQAAHHVRKHPGPLGHFFRKVEHRKNYNVAVVAVARKMAVIAWKMLSRNEPYRYAQPRATQVKLARLRTQGTGQRRKSGPAKGRKATAKLPGQCSRTIKPLAQVYQEEGLPTLAPGAAGEQRAVQESGAAEYVQSLEKAQLVPVKSKAKLQPQEKERSPAARSTGASSLHDEERANDARR